MNKGWYRVKLTPKKIGESSYTWYVNGVPALTCKIIANSVCSDSKLIKFLDKNGKYRFRSFLPNWKRTNTPTLIGYVENFVTSLKSSQSRTNVIGYTNKRKISLTAEHITDYELEILEDMYISPCVYLYVGNDFSTDLDSDWVKVKLTGDGIGRSSSKGLHKISVEIELPETYTIQL